MPGKKRYTLGQNKGDLQDLDLPSGSTCQARRLGVAGLIKAGLLDSFDELTALVKTEHLDPKSPKGLAAAKVTEEESETAAQAMMKDPEKLATAFWMVDRITAEVVVQPPVWVDYQMKNEPDEDFAKRAEKAEEIGAVAVREVDLEDKMFILNWAVGGSSELKSFRS